MKHYAMCTNNESKRWGAAIALLMGCLCAPLLHAGQASADNQFIGRWDLTIKAPTGDYPSWLQITDARGALAADLVGRGGNAHPLPKVEVVKDELVFDSPKQEDGGEDEMVFHGKLVNGDLVGTLNLPDGTKWQWVGKRAPSLERKSEPKWDKPIALFNGKNTDGWRFRDPNHAQNWKVEDGNLVTTGHGTEIITNRTFEDFKLHVEFKCGPNANSGIYLRGRDEVQIETDSIAEPASHHTGGVYGFIDPTPEQPRKDGVWQTMDITFLGRTVTVVQNGITVIDHKEIPGITGGALDSHEELPGPIYLQGSEEGTVAYRSVVITPAKQ